MHIVGKTRQQLSDKIWNVDNFFSGRNIYVEIARCRDNEGEYLK